MIRQLTHCQGNGLGRADYKAMKKSGKGDGQHCTNWAQQETQQHAHPAIDPAQVPEAGFKRGFSLP